jgi:hypothetical protein
VTTHRLTASRLQLAAECPPALALPWMERATPDAERGHARHRFMAQAVERGAATALAGVLDPEAREECVAIDVERIVRQLGGPFQATETEVAFAVRPTDGSARRLGRDIARQYEAMGCTSEEVPGTVDAIVYPPDAPPVVVDWKGYENAPPAGENRQVLFGALALRRCHGWPAVAVAIVYVGRDGGGYVDGPVTLGELELDAAAADLRRTWARHRSAVSHPDAATLRAGEHCRRCPALGSCPGKIWLAMALAGGGHSTMRGARPAMTPGEMGAVYERLRDIRLIERETSAYLREWGVEHDVVLSDGKTMRLADGRWREQA